MRYHSVWLWRMLYLPFSMVMGNLVPFSMAIKNVKSYKMWYIQYGYRECVTNQSVWLLRIWYLSIWLHGYIECGTIQYGYRECGTIHHGYGECGTIQHYYGECGTIQMAIKNVVQFSSSSSSIILPEGFLYRNRAF